MTDSRDDDRPLSEPAERVRMALEAGGPEMPIVVLARLTRIAPTQLVPLLDELYDAGLVDAGSERSSVRLLPTRATGRFRAPGTETWSGRPRA